MAYGNKQILQNQFESMKKWVDYVHNFGKEEYLWLGGDRFGDWLAIDNTDGSYIGATSVDYIASAFFAHSTDLTIKAGKVLGYDMSTYESLYKNIVTAFQHKFIKNDLPISKLKPRMHWHFALSCVPTHRKLQTVLQNLFAITEQNLPQDLSAPHIFYTPYLKTAIQVLLLTYCYKMTFRHGCTLLITVRQQCGSIGTALSKTVHFGAKI